MSIFRLSDDAEMFYTVDDFTDPWRKPETILLLHGNAESGEAWFGWVPALARQYRVVRPDMRGFGRSTPMPADHPWTLDELTDDFCRLMDHLGVDKFHVVAAKIGGTIARGFAARRPDRLLTLTVVGTPPPTRPVSVEALPRLLHDFETKGVRYWAAQNMASRLGGAFPPEGAEWWTDYMGRTAVSTQLGFMPTIAVADITADLPKIACPTLVIVTEESGLGSVAVTRAWQEMIPNSELVVLPGNSYHVAATHADPASAATLEFIGRKRPVA